MTTIDSPPAPPVQGASRRLNVLAAVVVGVLFFCAGLRLYTQHNDFPMRYHPDESGKVDQVLSPSHKRNYNHPQLLLEVSQRLLDIRPTSDPQQAVQVGRLASSLFSALTVVAAALIGYGILGLRGMLVAGAVLLFSPPMVIYSHYMKEDAALMLGLVLCLLASRWFWGRSSGRVAYHDLLAAGVMGAACAVAASGKYVGVYATAALLPLLFFPRGRAMLIPLRIVVFFVVAAGVALAINHLVLNDWNGFVWSLKAETHHGTTEHFDLAMDVPTGYFLRNTWETATLPVKLLAGLYVPLLLITRKRRTGWDVFPLVFFGISTAVISRCPIPFPRYGLPMVITFYVMAGMAGCFAIDVVDMAADRLGQWTPVVRRAVTVAVLALVLTVQVPICGDTLYQFGHDSRQGLREWLLAHGEPGASIAADFYAGLRDDGHPGRTSPGWEGFDVRPRWYGFAPQVVGLGNLRRFRYIAICDVAFDRYMVPEAHGYDDQEAEFEQRKQFYRTLIDRCTPVWKSVPEHPLHAYTNPTIYLYDTNLLPDDIR